MKNEEWMYESEKGHLNEDKVFDAVTLVACGT